MHDQDVNRHQTIVVGWMPLFPNTQKLKMRVYLFVCIKSNTQYDNVRTERAFFVIKKNRLYFTSYYFLLFFTVQ